jgi:hypothetical protein
MFTELHDKDSNKIFIIALDHIDTVEMDDPGARVYLASKPDAPLHVRESYERIRELLMQSKLFTKP